MSNELRAGDRVVCIRQCGDWYHIGDEAVVTYADGRTVGGDHVMRIRFIDPSYHRDSRGMTELEVWMKDFEFAYTDKITEGERQALEDTIKELNNA